MQSLMIDKAGINRWYHAYKVDNKWREREYLNGLRKNEKDLKQSSHLKRKK